MRASREFLSLTFPLSTRAESALAALQAISGLSPAVEVIFELGADEAGISHRLGVPVEAMQAARDQLGAAIPGVRLSPSRGGGSVAPTTAIRIAAPIRALLRTDQPVESSRVLLSGMVSLQEGEQVSLRWALRPATAPQLPDAQATSLQAKAELSLRRQRLGEPGFKVSGLLLITAESKRARELVAYVLALLRSRRGIGSGLTTRRGRVGSGSAMPSAARTRSWLTAAELLPLLGWPIGDEVIPGVELGAARQLPTPRHLAREGRRLFVGRDAAGERPVALSAEAARLHTAICGKTGSGKSTLIARGVLDDLDAGYGGVVIDPKADLVASILDRVPRRHADRVVVLDPATAGPVPGLDLLGVGDPELRSDLVLGVLRRLFADAWGVRVDAYLRLGLRTLADQPKPVLTNLPRLFIDTSFRRQAVGHIRDPLTVAAWQQYEALGVAEAQQHIAPALNRIMSLLSRPSVRNVLAQADPKLNIGRLLEERRWLLVPLSPGLLGEPAVELIGAVILYVVWSAIEARAALPPEKRHPIFVHLDELQAVSALPFSVEHFLERTRGLGAGVTIATQTLGRLPRSLTDSLLGNVGTLVSFKAGHDEAARIARELPALSAIDIQSLRRFEIAARVASDTGSAIVTGHTLPLPEPTGQAGRIRKLSAERYGTDPKLIEEALSGKADTSASATQDGEIGRIRRTP